MKSRDGITLFKQCFMLLLLLVTTLGCQTAYYSAMEKIGIHKRDIMLDKVEDAQTAQQDAQKQFKSALAQLTELIQYDGGDLAAQYELINDQYQESQSAAETVTKRIEAIETVAEDLFDEWRSEIDEISSSSLKYKSGKILRDTERNYEKLIKSMHRAETKMAPVLTALKDNSLFLKHNLNAKTIGALQGEYQSIKRDIESLVVDMNKAITQSQQFIDSLQKQ